MRQARLVALYGDKPSALARLITFTQGLIGSEFPDLFEPYEPPQVHATLMEIDAASVTARQPV